MRVASFGLFSALLIACVSDPSTGDAGKQTGEEDGPCFSDYTCKTGLVCNLGPNVCVKPGTDGSIVDTGTGGDGAPSDAPNADGDGGAMCLGGTLAWWQGNSTLNDHFNVATLMSFGTTGYTPAGKVDKAFDLGGSGHYSAPIMLGGAQAMTIEFWVQISSPPAVAQHLFVYADGNATPLWTVDIVAGQTQLIFTLATNSVTANISKGSYNHVAFEFDNSKIYAYVGGQSLGSTGAGVPSIPMGTGATSLIIGSDSDGGANFVGQLDEIALYRRALTVPDLSAIVAADTAGICRLQ